MGFDRDLDSFEEWVVTHRRRLKGAALQCFLQLLRASIARGDDVQSMRLAERAVAIEPACEEAHQCLIRTHAVRHDLHAAIEQFHICCEALRTQYHTEPSLDTCRLAEQIRTTADGGVPFNRGRHQTTRERRARERLTLSTPAPRSLVPIEDRPSIAVLPFVDLSAGQRDDSLVDGLTEEAITALAQIPGILVTARHSVMAYKGAAKDVRRIAAELGVKYVLEASIRRDRKQIRANLRLIDGQTGLHLWAGSSEKPLSDLMSVRDKFIPESINKLQARLLSAK